MHDRDLQRSMAEYRRKNPWIIQNTQNCLAHCGRYPSREAAVAAGGQYRGGVVNVSDAQRTVYVSEIPSL